MHKPSALNMASTSSALTVSFFRSVTYSVARSGVCLHRTAVVHSPDFPRPHSTAGSPNLDLIQAYAREIPSCGLESRKTLYLAHCSMHFVPRYSLFLRVMTLPYLSKAAACKVPDLELSDVSVTKARERISGKGATNLVFRTLSIRV